MKPFVFWSRTHWVFLMKTNQRTLIFFGLVLLPLVHVFSWHHFLVQWYNPYITIPLQAFLLDNPESTKVTLLVLLCGSLPWTNASNPCVVLLPFCIVTTAGHSLITATVYGVPCIFFSSPFGRGGDVIEHKYKALCKWKQYWPSDPILLNVVFM